MKFLSCLSFAASPAKIPAPLPGCDSGFFRAIRRKSRWVTNSPKKHQPPGVDTASKARPAASVAHLVVKLAAIVTLTLWTGGCTPESQILTGRWQSRETVGALITPGQDALLLTQGIELYLGHYGPDAVGVVRFYEQQFSSNDDLGHNIPPDPGCACTWLENGRYRDSKRFTFLLTQEKNDGCLPVGIDWPTNAKLQLEFDLYLVDDNMLTGTISTIGTKSLTQPVVFVRDPLETDLSEAEKTCSP